MKAIIVSHIVYHINQPNINQIIHKNKDIDNQNNIPNCHIIYQESTQEQHSISLSKRNDDIK